MAEFIANDFNQILFKRDESLLLDYLENLSTKIPDQHLNNLLTQIIQNKYWNLLDWCIAHDYIKTDLFEYDEFNRSPLTLLLKPYLHNTDDLAAYLPHLENYLSKIDDINEEIGGFNLLSFAIDFKSPIEILRAIISAGINMSYQTRYGETYLYKFCQQLRMPPPNAEQIIQLLIDNGVDVNAGTVEKKTALFPTIESSKTNFVKQLLENGADVNVIDWKGLTPFILAAAHLQTRETLQLLFEYGSPDFSHLTNEKENLLNATLRYFQGGENSLQIIDLLIANGADLTTTSEYYYKPKSGIDWVAEKPSELLSFLLERNYIEVNNVDNDGNTILMKVCMYDSNHQESTAKDSYRKVKLLLKHGADPSIENRFDKKAVDYAMEDQLKTKIVETLLA
ncbi:MAG: hypothetical protein DI598_03415 [Pseudopedobacter saltans]|uniref:Uncharacterized protein n=1 Tax=Pseudopedobacter saltans TaxID=151895 RepID=A0A2W5F7F9_9SPHI|nr:MAG: hypothetical protein DI598_03415 [Pseudopedobacter saltans]